MTAEELNELAMAGIRRHGAKQRAQEYNRVWNEAIEAAAEPIKKALDIHRWAFEQNGDERDNAAADALDIALAAIRKLRKP